jgi:hypothetical protein
LKETITSVGNVGEGRTSSLKNRPPEVAQHIIESAGEITEIADGDDKNIIARIMQSRMKELLT